MNMSHVIQANALKRRCVEIESEVTKLDETVLLLLEEKKRKLNKKDYFATNNFLLFKI